MARAKVKTTVATYSPNGTIYRDDPDDLTDWARVKAESAAGVEPQPDPDNPELDDEWFATAQHGQPALQEALAALRQGEPVVAKQSVHIRLDVDVVEWLKAPGPGYQTRLNAMLRKLKAASGQ